MHFASSRAQFEMHTLSLSQPMVHWTRIPTHCSLQILPMISSTQFSLSFGLYDSYACVKCDKNNENKILFIMALLKSLSQSLMPKSNFWKSVFRKFEIIYLRIEVSIRQSIWTFSDSEVELGVKYDKLKRKNSYLCNDDNLHYIKGSCMFRLQTTVLMPDSGQSRTN